ncbi:MAG: class I SAM-dependent methyltransferase [Bacteroidota bacterium]
MANPTNSPVITYSTCPVCSSSNIKLALIAKDYTVSKESFEIWHCNNCQHRFTQDIPNESNIGKYYQSEEYISHSNTQKGLINQIYQGVRNYTLRQKLKLVRNVSGLQTGCLLDIGCGTGEFLGTMKAAGWTVNGLEPDDGAREQAHDNFGLRVEESEKLFQLNPNTYNVITMWHVLEHVHRLHEYIDKIYELLKADGTLIIAVPNYQSKDANAYGEHWAAYDVPRHLYHFSPESMSQLLDGHGFTVDRMQHMPFDPFYVSMLSEKYLHGNTRLVSAFFKGLNSFMGSSGNAKIGSSVMYFIRKK